MPPRDQSQARTAFDRVAARLVAAGDIRPESRISSRDYRTVLRTLTRFARGLGLSEPDAEDVAASAVAEALSRRTDRANTEVRSAGAYLFWTTRNRALDLRRRERLRGAELLVEDVEASTLPRYYSQEDDAITRLLDRDATAALVEDALHAAVAAEDHLVVRVVTAWLDLADELDRAPSAREVAREAEVSHTSVNQALRRLRGYFPLE